MLHRRLLPLDHRTTVSTSLVHCSFGSEIFNESVCLDRVGHSLAIRHLEQERFRIAPGLRKGPALYVTVHGTEKRQYGRIAKGIGAARGSVFEEGCEEWRKSEATPSDARGAESQK